MHLNIQLNYQELRIFGDLSNSSKSPVIVADDMLDRSLD